MSPERVNAKAEAERQRQRQRLLDEIFQLVHARHGADGYRNGDCAVPQRGLRDWCRTVDRVGVPQPRCPHPARTLLAHAEGRFCLHPRVVFAGSRVARKCCNFPAPRFPPVPRGAYGKIRLSDRTSTVSTTRQPWPPAARWPPGWPDHGFGVPLWVLAAFCLYFFRDPERAIPAGPVAVSPADGKVVAVMPEGPALEPRQHLSEYLRRAREPRAHRRGHRRRAISRGPLPRGQPRSLLQRKRAERGHRSEGDGARAWCSSRSPG